MIRVFSEEKREELYEALDDIDLKDWKSFKEWCGSRINGFGNWMEKLDIQRYMSEVDAYQNRILNVNNSARRQIDIVFANVAEVDRRYAQIFREYEEVIKKKLAQVQAMIDVMRAANGEDKDEQGIYTDENVSITYAVERYIKNQNKDKIECGKQILLKRLIAQGITDRAEQQKIIDMIAEQKPGMLVNLYITDCYSSVDSNAVMKGIMEYYNIHKMDITIDDVDKLQFNGVPLQQIQKETFVECWNYLFAMGLTKEQVIAIIANMYAEGQLSPTNRQNTSDNANIEDPDYVYLTDDSVGYGICQWTYHSRKEGLLNMANDMEKEVSDIDVQLAYFQYEMEESYDFRDKWSDFLEIYNREEAVENFYRCIERPETSFNVNSEAYNNEVNKRRGFADDIGDWYEATFEK